MTSDAVPTASEIARIDHSLKSLLELARELSVSLDLYQTADLLLFNLMGQLGSGRAALWLIPESRSAPAVLVRCHGFRLEAVRRTGEIAGTVLRAHFDDDPVPLFFADLERPLGAHDFASAAGADVVLFAPLMAHSELLGWMALGSKLDRTGYADADLRILQAALGIVGVALQNAQLHTQVLEANRQLLASNEHLQEVDALKSEFLRNVNHELRTPLAVIMATLECVINVGSNEERIQSMLGGALASAHHLNNLLANVLTYASAVNARLAVELAEEDLGDVLRTYWEQRRPGVAASLREITFSCEPNIPTARCDRQRLLQILDQLVDNALKFTPSGSHLLLSVAALDEPDKRWVRVEFTDDGPGIPPERLPAVFNSFEQVDGSRTRTVGGLGMGLALARELAERMGCRLDVRSDVNRGSTFTLLVPVA
jgi:signal transduction histidine kinase